MLAKAKELRASISTLTFWDTDEKLAQIHKLLSGTSIELGPRVIALSERSLLDATYTDVTLEPERLLADMVKAFEGARTVLLSVSRAWESLDATIGEIEKEMTALRELAANLTPTDTDATVAARMSKDLAELTAVDAELASLRNRIQKDPLGAGDGLGKAILPRMADLRGRLSAERAVQQRAIANIERARKARQVLAERHERALETDANTTRELAFPAAHRGLGPSTRPCCWGLTSGLGSYRRQPTADDGRRPKSVLRVGSIRPRNTESLTSKQSARMRKPSTCGLSLKAGYRLDGHKQRPSALGGFHSKPPWR